MHFRLAESTIAAFKMKGQIHKQSLSKSQKRSLLSKSRLQIGLAAAAVIGFTGMYPAVAQVNNQRPLPTNPGITRPTVAPNTLNISKDKLEPLNKLSRPQLRQLVAKKRMPNSTPITKMGLNSKGVSRLTPEARRLNKGDLEKLGKGQLTPKLRKLSVEDVSSIKLAFTGGGYDPRAAISCCCCTPCCCAAAVIDQPQAA